MNLEDQIDWISDLCKAGKLTQEQQRTALLAAWHEHRKQEHEATIRTLGDRGAGRMPSQDVHHIHAGDVRGESGSDTAAMVSEPSDGAARSADRPPKYLWRRKRGGHRRNG